MAQHRPVERAIVDDDFLGLIDERLATVLYTVAEALRAIAVLYHPVMPRSTAAIWGSIGADGIGDIHEQRIGSVSRWGQLPPGSPVTKIPPLFPRLVEPA